MMTMGSTSLPKLNFPTKLHLILSNPEYSDLICWLPHGRAWRVQQQDRFETEVLPKFFHHQKFKSFARQVNAWGFHRVPSGCDFKAYYHDLFLRDAPELCRTIKRPTRSELAERKRALPSSPPDFYSMPPIAEENDDITSSTLSTTLGPIANPSMTMDEYRETLTRRLSTYSLTEKSMYLQLELNKLLKRQSQIKKQLQELRIQNNNHKNNIANRTSTTNHQAANTAGAAGAAVINNNNANNNNPLASIPMPMRSHPHLQIPNHHHLPQQVGHLANNTTNTTTTTTTTTGMMIEMANRGTIGVIMI